jgi:hypothetical protein
LAELSGSSFYFSESGLLLETDDFRNDESGAVVLYFDGSIELLSGLLGVVEVTGRLTLSHIINTHAAYHRPIFEI